MVTKKRSRYEVSEKEKMIHELDKNLQAKGANIVNPVFILSLNCIQSIQEKC